MATDWFCLEGRGLYCFRDKDRGRREIDAACSIALQARVQSKNSTRFLCLDRFVLRAAVKLMSSESNSKQESLYTKQLEYRHGRFFAACNKITR